jgi:hypothetical protein
LQYSFNTSRNLFIQRREGGRGREREREMRTEDKTEGRIDDRGEGERYLAKRGDSLS